MWPVVKYREIGREGVPVNTGTERRRTVRINLTVVKKKGGRIEGRSAP